MRVSEPGGAHRIGVILHDFPAGGTERIAIRLANRWARTGRAVTILCGTEAGPARSLVDDAVIVAPMTPNVPRSTGSRSALGRAIAMALPAARFDAIVTPGNFHLPIVHALGKEADLRRIALICKISNPLIRPERGRFVQQAFAFATRQSTRLADRLVTMSAALRDEAVTMLGQARVVTIAEPILDTPPSRNGSRAGRTILCAGRLVDQKRFDLALRAFALLPRPDARLVMLGDGAERDALVRLAKELGIAQRVDFVGHVADIQPWLHRADVLLLTSRFEGYPAVAVEAIGAGVPVVATHCSVAMPEILFHPSLGRLAEARPGALAAALLRVLEDAGVDEGSRAALAERHCATRAAAEWLALLDDAVAQKRA